MKQSQEQEALVRELDKRLSKRIDSILSRKFDEVEQKMLLRGTTLVKTDEACRIAGCGRTFFYEKGLNESLPHIDLPEGGRRFISELIVPSLAGIL